MLSLSFNNIANIVCNVNLITPCAIDYVRVTVHIARPCAHRHLYGLT